MDADARSVTLAVAPVEPGAEVPVVRQLLGAAIANLLSKAYKFSRRQGHVMIALPKLSPPSSESAT